MASLHGDSSSFYFHGEYESAPGNSKIAEEPDYISIEIKRGSYRDHRPDLKHFLLNRAKVSRLKPVAEKAK